MAKVEQHSEKERKPRKAMRGIHNLRTPIKARLRSKPTVEGHEYLDLYVLSQDRARWERMREQSRDSLSEIDEEMRKSYENLPLTRRLAGQGSSNERSVARGDAPRPAKPMKKVPLDY